MAEDKIFYPDGYTHTAKPNLMQSKAGDVKEGMLGKTHPQTGGSRE
jgi:hypothetical protein